MPSPLPPVSHDGHTIFLPNDFFNGLLALWAAFAAFIGTAVTGKGPLITLPLAISLTVAAFIVFALHSILHLGLHKANALDKQITVFYADKMNEMLNLAFEHELAERLGKARKKWGTPWHWSTYFQLGVTLVLAVGVILVSWSLLGMTRPDDVPTVWRYRLLAGDDATIQTELDRLADDGWELKGLAGTAGSGKGERSIVVMQKRK
jgi:hypothetical protein